MKKSVAIVFLLYIFSGIITAQPCSGVCYTGVCIQPRLVPYTIYDYSTLFNEKRYWLEINDTTGEVQICYQRIDVNHEYFMTPNIHCYRAHPVPTPSTMSIPGPAHCWQADNIIVCKNDATGEMFVEQNND